MINPPLQPNSLPKLPPTQAELPCDDGEPMETARHKFQMDLLIDVLYPWLEQRPDGFVNGNMFVYYSLEQVKNQDFRGPDFFAVLNVPQGERLSWVCWEEGKSPDVVIELLSESTAAKDKGEKKQIYQDKMRVPEYFWYDPFNSQDFAGFHLQSGVYQPIAPNSQGYLISQVLNLALIRWTGEYRGIHTTWIRWAYLDGTLLLNSVERAAIAQQQAEAAQHRAAQSEAQAEAAQQQAEAAQHRAAQSEAQAEAAQQQAEAAQQQAEAAQQRAAQSEVQVLQIVRNLRSTSMSLPQIAEITGLSVEKIEEFMLSEPL